MNYTLAVFKSRFATLNFANILKSRNIPVAIINTPNMISQSCGISVKFLSDFLPLVREILAGIGQRQFDGFYSQIYKNGQISIVKL